MCHHNPMVVPFLTPDSDNYHQDHQHKTTTVGSQAGPGSIHLTSDKSRVPENSRLASGNNGDPRNTNRGEGVGGPGSGNLDLILDRINIKRVISGSDASSGLSSGPSDSTSDRGMTGGSAGGTRDSSDSSAGTGRMTGGADHGGGNSGMSAVPGTSEIANGSRDGGSGPLGGTPGGRGGLSYFGGGGAGISNIPGQVTAGDSSSTRGSGNSDNTGGSRSLGDLLSGSLGGSSEVAVSVGWAASVASVVSAASEVAPEGERGYTGSPQPLPPGPLGTQGPSQDTLSLSMR